jgi:hypothetical protein
MFENMVYAAIQTGLSDFTAASCSAMLRAAVPVWPAEVASTGAAVVTGTVAVCCAGAEVHPADRTKRAIMRRVQVTGDRPFIVENNRDRF